MRGKLAIGLIIIGALLLVISAVMLTTAASNAYIDGNFTEINITEDIQDTINLTQYEFYEDGSPGSKTNNLTWEITTAPPTSEIKSAIVTVSDDLILTPAEDFFGSTNITLKLKEENVDADEKTIIINVENTNDDPKVTAISNQFVQEDHLTTIDISQSISDPDETNFSNLTVTDNSNYVTVNKTDTKVELTFDYKNETPSSETINITVTDGDSATDSTTFTVTIAATDNKAFFENDTYAVTAINEDGPKKTLNLLTVPGYDNDGENENVTFEIIDEDSSEVDCTINGTILEYTPAKDFSGTGIRAASCDVQVNDANSQAYRTRVSQATTGLAANAVRVSIPVNPDKDSPEIVKDFNMTLKEDISYSETITASNWQTYFKDPDSEFKDFNLTENSANIEINQTNTSIKILFNYTDPVTNGYEDVTFTVTDQDAKSSAEVFRINVTSTDNKAFFINETIERSIKEDADADTMDLSGAQYLDNDGETETLKYTVDWYDSTFINCSVNETSGVLTFAPIKDQFTKGGEARCQVIVEDVNSTANRKRADGPVFGSAQNKIRLLLTIAAENDNVTFIAANKQFNFTMDTNYTLEFKDVFRDGDNDDLNYSVVDFDNASIKSITINETAETAFIVPVKGFYGETRAKFNATDGQSDAEGNVSFKILLSESAPQFLSPFPSMIFNENEQEVLNLRWYAWVPNTPNANITFTKKNVDSNLNVEIKEGEETVTVSAKENWNGNASFTLTANNNGLSTDQVVNVIVKGVNQAPSTPTLSSPVDGAELELTSLDANLSWSQSTDPEGDAITYTVVLRPTDSTSKTEHTSSTNSLTVALPENNKEYEWYVIAKDTSEAQSNESGKSKFKISVDFAPTIDTFKAGGSSITGDSVTINEGQSLEFTQTSSDEDSADLTFSWELDGTEVSTATSYTYEADLKSAGNHTLKLIVSDGTHQTSKTVTIIVQDVSVSFSLKKAYPEESQLLIGSSDSQEFRLDLNNPLNLNVEYEWQLNSVKQSVTSPIFSFTPTGMGPYTLTIIATPQNVPAAVNAVTASWVIQVANKPTSRSGQISGTITQFSGADLASATGVTIENNKASVDFGSQAVNLRDVIDLDAGVKLANNLVAIDSSKFASLNKKATIVLREIRYNEKPKIFFSPEFTSDSSKINIECYTCELVNYTAAPTSSGEVIFNVNGFSSYRIGNAVVTPTPSPTTPTPSEEGKLQIKKLRIDGDRVTVDPSGRKTIDDIKPEQRVEIELKIENIFTSRTSDPDIEDIEVEVTIFDIDDSADLEFDSDRDFDLEPREDEEITLDFKVPVEVEDGKEYEILIEVEGEDEDGETHRAKARAYIEIEKEDHRVKITSLDISPRTVSCARTATLRTEVTNLGKDKEDGAKLRISNADLDINQEFTFDLDDDPDDRDFSIRKDIILTIGRTIAAGVYEIKVEAFDERGRVSDTRTEQLVVKDCEDVSLPTMGAGEGGEVDIQFIENIQPMTTTDVQIRDEFQEDMMLVTLLASIVIIIILVMLILYIRKK